jgi:hypothetical protein
LLPVHYCCRWGFLRKITKLPHIVIFPGCHLAASPFSLKILTYSTTNPRVHSPGLWMQLTQEHLSNNCKALSSTLGTRQKNSKSRVSSESKQLRGKGHLWQISPRCECIN